MANPQLDEEAIFHVARGIPDVELRSVYLGQICAGDQALRERVEAQLEVHEQSQEFLKSGHAQPAPIGCGSSPRGIVPPWLPVP